METYEKQKKSLPMIRPVTRSKRALKKILLLPGKMCWT